MFFSYQYKWELEESKKNILRTHTTAVSTRMLYKLAQEVLKVFLKKLNDNFQGKYFELTFWNEVSFGRKYSEMAQVKFLEDIPFISP